MSLFSSDYSYWTWLILGLILAGLELIAPGIFIIWIAISAIFTGLLDFFFGFSWQTAFVVFSILSVISVFTGRYIDNLKRKAGDPSEGTERFIGQIFSLTESIQDGYGRIRIGDSSWRVKSTETIVKGTQVRIIGLSPDKTVLLVESSEKR